MLSVNYRLTKDKDFERIAKKGKAFYSQEIILKFIQNQSKFSHFGFICSLKVSKKAVIRNKIKRRLRGIIKDLLEQIKPGFDIMILSKPEIKKLDYSQIQESLIKLLTQSKLLIKN